ncbi:uncharacterized protein GGS25DRAFT_521200 [Hypoxylon fragiforme]|uniref:uncharacterized protein n=1 Tax=Hypoxylon fragiforme TaxID=63214 RepID=UPI0020C61FD9|nr:uncharacterized protein GGS25DRAFT_521200 [Hypoxylon fragiforme]KAI2610399.1 hypothetical protein GGS25DRAFT_521200 [Hypoxylon fragiforme]
MSEYWKSTPRYWCKHCSIHVRDTKFERQNHEATAKHQGNLKRFLRDLHRNHENELREKERAKREIERLNGVVTNTTSDQGPSTAPNRIPPSMTTQATNTQRKQQWEQLAEMGIDVPTELRGDLAMAGEWTVTKTKVISDTSKSDDPDAKPENIDAIASGVRKRPKPEEDEDEGQEEENAVNSLFKKPRRWGRDTKQAPEDDAELDALLGGTLTKLIKPDIQPHDSTKKEDDSVGTDTIEESSSKVKNEDKDDQPLTDIKPAAAEDVDAPPVKQEEDTQGGAPAVVFKKRKPKHIRQR